MFRPLKKIFFTISFNISLFLILMIGIQNSSNTRKVNLILSETVSLPISFIIGVSFISGSLTGSLLTTNFINQKQYNLYSAINLSPLTILEIPLETKIGATILNTSVFGTFITFCSLLQNLFAFLRSSKI